MKVKMTYGRLQNLSMLVVNTSPCFARFHYIHKGMWEVTRPVLESQENPDGFQD